MLFTFSHFDFSVSALKEFKRMIPQCCVNIPIKPKRHIVIPITYANNRSHPQRSRAVTAPITPSEHQYICQDTTAGVVCICQLAPLIEPLRRVAEGARGIPYAAARAPVGGGGRADSMNGFTLSSNRQSHHILLLCNPSLPCHLSLVAVVPCEPVVCYPVTMLYLLLTRYTVRWSDVTLPQRQLLMRTLCLDLILSVERPFRGSM